MINILEIIMIITTIMYSYLIIYCKRSGFIYGIISTGIMGYIFMDTGIYVQAILNFVYAITYIYSYFNWGSKKAPSIRNINKTELIFYTIIICIGTLLIGYAFDKVGGVYPYIDSFAAACSIVAAFLLSAKVIQNTHIFVISNIASIVICYASQNYITILIYMVFNIIRYVEWKKELNTK